MKKTIILLFLSIILTGCLEESNCPSDENPMSGYMLGEDMHTTLVENFMKAYRENNISSSKDMFASDAIFSVNDTEMSVEDMMKGFSAGHEFFENITHSNVDTATMYYNNGRVFTNLWYDWSAVIKSSGETLTARGYGWFEWQNGKVIEAYNAFDPTDYNAAMSTSK